MIIRRFRPWTFAVLGAAVFLLLQLHFSLAWPGYYARFPFKGYERAMEEANIPPFFTTSPRSLLVHVSLFCSCPSPACGSRATGVVDTPFSPFG